MAPARAACALLLCAALAACQTWGQHQFVLPLAQRGAILAELQRVGAEHQMRDCLADAAPPHAVSCFIGGDASFTFVGAREARGQLVIDLSYRSAGLMGGSLYGAIVEDLRGRLRRLCGTAAVQEPAPADQIPSDAT